jgi:hypothetical protein
VQIDEKRWKPVVSGLCSTARSPSKFAVRTGLIQVVHDFAGEVCLLVPELVADGHERVEPVRCGLIWCQLP